MRQSSFTALPPALSHRSKAALLALGTACLGLFAGCGSGSTPPVVPVVPAATKISLLATATANDKLSNVSLTLTSLKLTNKSGNTFDLISTPVSAEFAHLNGTSEPLITASIPEDNYVSATATVSSARFTCVTLDPASLYIDTPGSGGSNSPVTIQFASPLMIRGSAMSLSLNLLVSPSITYTDCKTAVTGPFSIDPTFALTAAPLPPEAMINITGLEGLVQSVNASGNSFILTTQDAPSLTVQTSPNTVFQGVAASSALVAGMPVDLDASMQPDNSLLATRVEVLDPDPKSLSLFDGSLIRVVSSQSTIDTVGRAAQGYLTSLNMLGSIGPARFSFGTATFGISGQHANLSALPFTPSFTGANMVSGQNVALTTHATQSSGGPLFIPASTVTLMPQTIDGTVVSTGTSGNFQTYTVSLAPYELFSVLYIQPGQTTLLSNPNTIVAYVDSTAQMNNTAPIGTGTVVRFTGLVFNDNGTLRMAVSSVNDGVPE